MSRRIIYSCPFVPAEWISAHGFQPSRIISCASKGDFGLGMRAGMCSYVHAFANSALAATDAAAIVVTTLCDQMRRVFEFIEESSTCPVFLMNVPHTWESLNARGLYASEIERLGRFLVRLGGESASGKRLAGVMTEYDAARRVMISARGHMTARAYSEALAEFNLRGGVVPTLPDAGYRSTGISLGLVGGPLLLDHFQIFDMIEAAGGRIVLDGTETGERTMPGRFDPGRMHDDPFSALVDAYFGHIPDAARRPDSALYQWLRQEIRERELKGVILTRHIWCDTWHAESQRMKEQLDVPVFDLDITEDATDISRRLTRLEAFMEMLG